MHTQAAQDPFAFLYNTESNPFPGYQPEAAFTHGAPVVISRIPACHWSGCSSVISETRTPASFFTAIVTDRNGRRLKFSTGSGDEVIKLLNKICKGLADGTVQLTPTARAYHSLGIGIGWSRVVLSFEDIMFMATVANEIRMEMLSIEKLD
jgi:hypothetical protein